MVHAPSYLLVRLQVFLGGASHCIMLMQLKNMVTCWKISSWIRRTIVHKCFLQVGPIFYNSESYGFVLATDYSFVGELERLFLVLRETVAVARIKAKDEARGVAQAAADVPNQVALVQAAPVQAAPAPPSPIEKDQASGSSFSRGVKRDPSTESGAPSKRR